MLSTMRARAGSGTKGCNLGGSQNRVNFESEGGGDGDGEGEGDDVYGG